MKTIQINAGQRTRIISKFSNSISTTYRFTASSLSGNGEPTGTIEVKGSNWIFPKPPTSQKLARDNAVAKTMWDTFYSVHVTPDQGVHITLEEGRVNRALLYAALALGITAIAIAMALFGMN